MMGPHGAVVPLLLFSSFHGPTQVSMGPSLRCPPVPRISEVLLPGLGPKGQEEKRIPFSHGLSFSFLLPPPSASTVLALHSCE